MSRTCRHISESVHLKSSLRRGAPFIVLVALAGCDGQGTLSLERLANNQDAYVGKEVRTTGRVEEQTNANGTHYFVLADRAQNLVILVPARRARPYAGRDVSVSGRFGFNPHVGRLIRIAVIGAAS